MSENAAHHTHTHTHIHPPKIYKKQKLETSI